MAKPQDIKTGEKSKYLFAAHEVHSQQAGKKKFPQWQGVRANIWDAVLAVGGLLGASQCVAWTGGAAVALAETTVHYNFLYNFYKTFSHAVLIFVVQTTLSGTLLRWDALRIQARVGGRKTRGSVARPLGLGRTRRWPVSLVPLAGRLACG